MEGLDAMLENGPWFIRNNPLILKKWHPDENLLKEDVSTVPLGKLHGVLWKPPRCASSKVFGHIHEECPKNTGAREKKTTKKPCQTSRVIIRKKGVEPTIEVSNSNPFEVLNSVDNDVELGTNANLINNATTSSGSFFMNVDNISMGTTPILEKIRKFEDILTSGQIILVDNVGNPLKNVEFLGSARNNGDSMKWRQMYITRFSRSTKGLKNNGNQVDIEKFDGTGDFRLWRSKMRALLIQHGCEAALEVLPADMEAQTKSELNKKAHSAVILCLASYEHFLDTLLYRREALTLEDVMATLNSNEIKERSKAKGDDGEGLYVRGRTDRRDSRYVKKGDQQSSSGSIYDDSEVMIVMSVEALLDWIMSGKVKVINGSWVLLSGIRRDNCVYSLDGHAVAGEINASVEEKDSLSQFKHKAFKKFKEWKQLVENQTGRTVKKLRTDNGLEFCNWEFEQLCVESGTTRHLTVVRTPQKNGLAERMNRTLMSPSTAIEKKTPIEMWSGHPNTLKDSGAGANKSVEKLHVEVELQELNNHTLKEDQTYQEDGDDGDAGDEETDQTSDLTYYQLGQERNL
ncbi:retrovirus-related pol polyprotein from transposon TNT 1-94 [Tanacetum coccineum]